jgi:hypothetical protein
LPLIDHGGEKLGEILGVHRSLRGLAPQRRVAHTVGQDCSRRIGATDSWDDVLTAGVSLTEGRIEEDTALAVSSEMNDGGVVFGGGLEADRLEFGWGRRLEVRVAPDRLRLVA